MGVQCRQSFSSSKLRTDTDSVQGAEQRRAIPRSELTEAELQSHQRVLLTERHVRFPRILSVWCSKEVMDTYTEEKIVEAIEAFDPDVKRSHQCR